MDKASKKSLIVKLICVLLSFILWMYISNVENPIRTIDMRDVTVELLNTDILSDNDLYISPDQSYTVDLKLEGATKDIYSVKKSDFTLKADLSGYALKKGENNIPVEVVNEPDGVTIKNKTVLSIKLTLEEGSEKSVKVSSNVKTSFKNGTTQKGISVSPNSVKVSGPESLVSSVVSVVLQGEISDISKDVSQSFKLVPVDVNGNEVSGVELSEEKGKLTIDVGSEKQVTINAVYTGKLSDNLTLKSITLSKDKVSIVGDSNVINLINEIDTEAINLSNITESGNVNITLNLPDGVSLADKDDKITAYVEVEKKSNIDEVITKKIDGVKVNLLGKENTNLAYEVDSVTVEVSGKTSEVSTLTAENIKASATVSSLNVAGEYEVNLDVSLVNSGTSVTIISKPEKIKVTVK